MDKQHFVSTIPMYTYLVLKRWLYFTIFLYLLFFGTCLFIELPFVWQWYQKRLLYNKQKNIYAQEQELFVEQQNLEKSIKQLTENKLVFLSEKPLMSNFLRMLLKRNEQFAIVSLKKTNQSFMIEGTGNQMTSITTSLHNIALETGYTMHINSIERKNNHYMFQATCYKKIKIKNKDKK